MIRDERARLTLPDLMFVLFGFAFIGGLWPVVMKTLGDQIGILSQGELLLYQSLLPLLLAVVLTILFVKATAGGTKR